MNYSIFKPERVIKGVTLIELAVIIIILAILAGAAVPRLTSIFEDADAQVLRSVAAEAELAIAAGLNRGKNYHQLTTNGMGFLDDILSYIEESHDGTVDAVYTDAASFTVSIVDKGTARNANYIVANDGRVMITEASGFNYYYAYAGDLVKNQPKSSDNTVIASAAASALQSIGQAFGSTSDESSASIASSSTGSSLAGLAGGSSSGNSASSSSGNSANSSGSSAASSASSSSSNSSGSLASSSSGSSSSGNSASSSSSSSAGSSASSSSASNKNKSNNGNAYAYGKNRGNNGRGNAYAYGRPVASPY